MACSVTLAVVVKQFSAAFAASGKKPYLYGLLSSAVATGAGYLASVVNDNLYTVFWFLAAIYLLFGILHLKFVHKKYFDDKTNSNKALIAELLFGISIILFSIVIFSSLQYFIRERDFLFYPMLLSMVTFFIPFLFYKTFESAYSIPLPVYKTWQYPLNTLIEVPDEKPGEKIVVIAFEIAKKNTDYQTTVFRAKAPDSMLLGELFYHFINDYNDLQSETPIEYAKDGLEPNEWIFRRKPRWFELQKILDPDITIRENGIKENTVIICDRFHKS